MLKGITLNLTFLIIAVSALLAIKLGAWVLILAFVLCSALIPLSWWLDDDAREDESHKR